jgi:hypothetical protein
MKRIPWLLIGWAGSLAAAPIVWWLVGDVSESLGDKRTWAAPDWLLENADVFARYGVAVIVGALALEWVGMRMRVIGRDTILSFLPLVAAASVVAFGYRVMTSFSHGSNTRAMVAAALAVPVIGSLAGIHLSWLRANLKRLRGF